ncbi:hypothetical protein GXW78_22430 [Roseomonas terrae]|uniref:Lipoprotein n=1 Tax=Neoroseomonas terrae TaxID=424799 RepID=A0ABS5EN97_9PROT|nr:hypothetical protein [Neoroseomonas terrae]MBR0652430.1 hypothetical protein [Neoroseomonas terrae]
MKHLLRALAALPLLAAVAGCGAPAPGQNAAAVQSLAPDANLDARSLGRGVAAARPAAVQVQDNPGSPTILYAVSPRLQTGSPASLPMIVTSLGAERQRADGSIAYRALVVVSNARGQAGFSRATTRQGDTVPVRTMSRERDCAAAAGCVFVETLMLTFPPEMLRQAVEANAPIRLRISGSASFIEVGIPAGHIRALLEAAGGTAPRA